MFITTQAAGGTVTKPIQPSASNTYRVLSLDGGGIRGLVPAYILSKLESTLAAPPYNLPKPITQYFDLIIGTSAGGILTCLYRAAKTPGTATAAMTAGDVYNFFRESGPGIFQRPAYGSFWQLLGPKFKTSDLTNPLGNYIRPASTFGAPAYTNGNGNGLLTGCDTAIVSFFAGSSQVAVGSAINTYSQYTSPGFEYSGPLVFLHAPTVPANVTFKGSFVSGESFSLLDVVAASAAAPSFFPPVPIGGIIAQGSQKMSITFTGIDGGVAANNPALVGYMLAKNGYLGQGYTTKPTNVSVLSIGTGRNEKTWSYEKLSVAGLPFLAQPLLGMFLSAGMEFSDGLLGMVADVIPSTGVLSTNYGSAYVAPYIRIQPDLTGQVPDIDGASTTDMDYWNSIASSLWDKLEGVPPVSISIPGGSSKKAAFSDIIYMMITGTPSPQWKGGDAIDPSSSSLDTKER